MALTVRPATLDDSPLIVEFNRLMAHETEGKALDTAVLTNGVRAALSDAGKGLYFIADDDGVVVGQTMVTTEWSDWRNGWFWWIQSVYVRPEARRRGVFKALYQHLLEAARRAPSVIGIRLYVEHENRRAQETYLSLGMKRTGYLLLEHCPLSAE
jgi:ribosomal protein S18 acetylase RimI-like enzyme